MMRGRWAGVLVALGMDPSFLTGKHSPCPMCGGKDRFRFINTNGDGTYVCNGCGGGDGPSLLMRFKNVDFRAMVGLIDPVLGMVPVAPRSKFDWTRQSRGSTPEQKRQRRELWTSGAVVAADDPVGHYLISRLGVLHQTKEIRAVLCNDGALMLARVRAPDDSEATLHRTYLTSDGKMIERKMMPGPIPNGAAVRLMPYDPGHALGIAEGIETALSASMLFAVPCWAALNAGMLSSWMPPADVPEVWIFGDNDQNQIGQKAAAQLERRCTALGRTARVHIPEHPDTDWNDHLPCGN